MSTEGDHVEEGREGGKRVEGIRSRCMENVSAEASTSASVRDWTSAGSKVAEEMGGALCDKVKAAVRVIRKAVATYGAEHLALSFNGGKDSTVLLALLAAARATATSPCAHAQKHTQTPDANTHVDRHCPWANWAYSTTCSSWP